MKKKSLVISSSNDGRLGNRLFIFANFIAFAIENQYQVFNPSFYDYAHFFQGTANNLLCSYPKTSFLFQPNRFLRKTLFKIIDFVGKQGLIQTFEVEDLSSQVKQGGKEPSFNLVDLEVKKQIDRSSMTLFRGALFRGPWYELDRTNLIKHGDQVRSYFQPLKIHQTNVANLISQAKKDTDILVGVHIRHGDYKKTKGGKLYFTTEEYAQAMQRCQTLFPGKTVKFLICSDAKQPEKCFENLNYILGNNHLIEDMYSFAECDFIMGARSTFTLWAAFYGDKPIYQIDNIHTPFSLNDFVYPFREFLPTIDPSLSSST